jgi:hypothetical protein
MPEGALLGSLIFWLPMVMARAAFGPDWSVLLILFPLTLVLPVFACFVLEIFAERWRCSRGELALTMLVGIWASAGFWITLANTATPGEGFHMAGAWSFVGLMTAAFPLTTIMLCTYHGSLGALFLTTIAVLVFPATRWTFHPILRRCFICRFVLSE